MITARHVFAPHFWNYRNPKNSFWQSRLQLCVFFLLKTCRAMEAWWIYNVISIEMDIEQFCITILPYSSILDNIDEKKKNRCQKMHCTKLRDSCCRRMKCLTNVCVSVCLWNISWLLWNLNVIKFENLFYWKKAFKN